MHMVIPRITRTPGFLCAACSLLLLGVAHTADLRDLDSRISAGWIPRPKPGQVEALTRLRNERPTTQVLWHHVTASPSWIWTDSGYLTRSRDEQEFLLEPLNAGSNIPSGTDDQATLARFLDQHAELFGHGADELVSAELTRDYVTEHNGMHTLVWRQVYQGIPVYEATVLNAGSYSRA